MSYTIAEVRDGLMQTLARIPGWRATAYVIDQVNPDEIQVSRPPFDPRYVLGQGKARHTFRATAYVPRTAEVQGQEKIDALCELTGATSLIATVQNGDYWPIVVDYAQVINVGEVAPAEIAGIPLLACPFEIEVVW